MSNASLRQHEAVSQYSQKQILHLTTTAHQKATALLDAICAEIRPGVTEAEIREKAKAIFEQNGVAKAWHRSYIYFGEHTLRSAYDSKPKDILTLGKNDIAYVDIGPVINVEGVEIEGDVGRTLAFGENPVHHQLKQTSETLFQRAVAYWRQHNSTGIALYEQIFQWTKEAGLQFNLEPAGHLIGSFPHTGWKQGLHTYPYQAEPGIWILEIQLRHPVEPYGAFYEAVLA